MSRTIERADAANARVGEAQRDLLVAILDIEREDAWIDDGARDLAHWVSMRYGVSHWKACRWIDAARSFERLPQLAGALAHGSLSLDKVVELARFATAETVNGLVRWAEDVSAHSIRRRADLEARRERDEAEDVHRTRSLEWSFFDDGRRFGMEVELPAADGERVVRAIEALASVIPELPDEEGPDFISARRADALVALCSSEAAADGSPDRATVVVHARLDGLVAGTHGCEIEGGPAIHPAVVQRLLCDARVQILVEDERADVVKVGATSRLAPPWMERQVRYRDGGCTFPGCGTRRFTHVHHVRWWRDGGETSLENLTLICSFHHRLVHERGWVVERLRDGDLAWRRPDVARWRAGARPREPVDVRRSA
jgi:Domain of unknown function (DUF222)/HNH endonuclease